MSVTLNGTSGLTFNDGSSQNTSAYGGGFAMRNRIINGGMTVDQRNAGASVSPTASQYTLDRWNAIMNATGAKYSVEQTISGVAAPTGFSDYLGVTSLSAYTVAAGEIMAVQQAIEGFNIADLAWGTAAAQTVTLSFWVRSSLTGTFGGAVRQGSGARSYPFTYTISAANTWEQKAITIAGDTSGTYASGNTAGLLISWGFGVGSTFSGTAGAWSGSNLVSSTGATSVVGTNGATFYITGVQLEKGSTATSFDYRPYGTELSLCQRYYQRIQGDATAQRSVANGVVGSTTQIFRALYPIKVQMRASPTCASSGLTGYDGTSNVAVSLGTGYQTAEQISFDVGGGSGYAVGRIGIVLTGSSATSYFDASAEL